MDQLRRQRQLRQPGSGCSTRTPKTHDHLFPYPPPAILDRLAGPPQACNIVVLPEEQPLSIFLRWDDSWPGASLDLDIYVYDLWTGKKIRGIGGRASANAQGHATASPWKSSRSIVSLPAGDYCLHIHNASAAHSPQAVNQRPWIQLQLWGGFSNYLFTVQRRRQHCQSCRKRQSRPPGRGRGSSTTIPHLIAYYSSRGPTTDGRIKPDVVGVAGFHSNAYQHPICKNPARSHPHLCPFPGTSQASPHVAGLAALAKQRLGLPPAQLVEYLIRNTVARPGSPDHIWGQGLAQLPALGPTLAIAPTPTIETDLSCLRPDGMSPNLACDMKILVAIKDTLRGTSTELIDSWDGTRAPRARFEGVSVEGNPRRVQRVSLYGGPSYGSDPRLAGTIPPELGLLTELRELDLHNNQLTGPIPPELGQLVHLQQLNLGGNQLTGRSHASWVDWSTCNT